VRSNNQDSVYAGPRLLAVADGMGGHAAGEVASKLVIGSLAHLDDDEPSDDLLGQLRDAVADGNQAIVDLVAQEPDFDGMGTTLTAILFGGNRIGLCNIGDSRTYLHRNGVLTQITHDDTFVQSLVDEGRITPEEANTHPQRSLLLRALMGHDVEPTLTIRETKAGDRYLLCSDGLCGLVSHETLAEAMKIPDPQTCADRMIELALKSGGTDNVTVIIADVVDVDFGEDVPIIGGAAGNGQEQQAPPDSPAARAQAITAPRPAAPPPVPEQPTLPDAQVKRKRWFRVFMILGVVLVVLAGGVLGLRFWIKQQYYIGVAGSDQSVSIFQGLSYSAFGVSLSNRVQGSCITAAGCEQRYLSDFNESTQDTLKNDKITASSLTDANNKLTTLMSSSNLLPLCTGPTGGTGSSTSTTSSAPTTSSSASTTPSSGASSVPTAPACRQAHH
jgi:protein phosphatase